MKNQREFRKFGRKIESRNSTLSKDLLLKRSQGILSNLAEKWDKSIDPLDGMYIDENQTLQIR